jgi:hypothetical protein
MKTRFIEMADDRRFPDEHIVTSAFLIAHALRGGRELQIKRDGTTTIEGVPLVEFFAQKQKAKRDVIRDDLPIDGARNIFRIHNGLWKLAFGGFVLHREPNSIGLRYSRNLVREESCWRRSGHPSLCLCCLGTQLHPRQNPQIVHQHGPGDRQSPMRQSFAAQASIEEDIFHNADPPFDLGAPPL